jgi:hypothetical protein
MRRTPHCPALRLQAFLRSGCVHLTYEALWPESGQPPSWEQLAAALGPELLAARPVLLQLGSKAVVLAAGGQQAACWGGAPAALQNVSPCCVVAGQAAQLLVSGRQLDGAGVKMHARCQGHFLRLEPPAEPLAGDCGMALAVQLPALAAPGRVSLELEQSLLVSSPLQLVVVPNEEMAQEVCRLEAALPRGQAQQVGQLPLPPVMVAAHHFQLALPSWPTPPCRRPAHQ